MRFLIIRFSSLGDIIQTTAFANKLKEIYPNATVMYATKEEFGDILKNQPYIDRLILLKKNEKLTEFVKRVGKVHCIFDLHSNIRSIAISRILNPACIKRVNKNTLYRYALIYKLNGILPLKRETKDNIEEQLKLLNIKDESSKPVIHVKKLKTDKKIIGFAPGARWKTKMWPKEYYRSLAGILTDKGYEVYLFGSKEEKEISEFIKAKNPKIKSFTGKLSISETASVMSLCKAFVSNDSALMHLAVALDIPTVAIFGPTVKGFGFFPRGRSTVLELDLPCRPCSLHGSDKCTKGTLDCLKNIKPEDVYNALKQWLN